MADLLEGDLSNDVTFGAINAVAFEKIDFEKHDHTGSSVSTIPVGFFLSRGVARQLSYAALFVCPKCTYTVLRCAEPIA